MSPMLFLGADPGKAGGVAIVDAHGAVLLATRLPETDADLLDVLLWPAREAPLVPCRAVLEAVHSSPQMGVTSAFSFGLQFGRLRMGLAAARVPFDEVSPLKWQRRMECLSGGDKKVTRARAKQLFPGVKVTDYVADALILAEYARRTQRTAHPFEAVSA